jgi:methylated-DNA-[protein]-cysteine S-methyltransferase
MPADRTWFSTLATPIGPLLLVKNERGLCGVYMQDAARPPARRAHWREDAARLGVERAQLGEYFAGTRTRFELALAPEGTPFQRRVWQALLAIPYGRTTTYGELARALGEPGAARAVGAANGRNPVSIVVPCHRVIGAGGALTGYGGGIPRKKWLLAHEARVAGASSHVAVHAELFARTATLSLIDPAIT